MAWTIKTDSITGLMKFRLTDEDGDAVASFRLNPADARTLKGLETACAEAQKMAEAAPAVATTDDIATYNDKLEGIVCNGLGIKRDSVFGVIPGTTILPDGDLYAVHVLGTVADVMAPEIAKRKGKMQDAAAKYTAKYK
jgi:hypothetical protein